MARMLLVYIAAVQVLYVGTVCCLTNLEFYQHVQRQATDDNSLERLDYLDDETQTDDDINDVITIPGDPDDEFDEDYFLHQLGVAPYQSNDECTVIENKEEVPNDGALTNGDKYCNYLQYMINGLLNDDTYGDTEVREDGDEITTTDALNDDSDLTEEDQERLKSLRSWFHHFHFHHHHHHHHHGHHHHGHHHHGHHHHHHHHEQTTTPGYETTTTEGTETTTGETFETAAELESSENNVNTNDESDKALNDGVLPLNDESIDDSDLTEEDQERLKSLRSWFHHFHHHHHHHNHHHHGHHHGHHHHHHQHEQTTTPGYETTTTEGTETTTSETFETAAEFESSENDVSANDDSYVEEMNATNDVTKEGALVLNDDGDDSDLIEQLNFLLGRRKHKKHKKHKRRRKHKSRKHKKKRKHKKRRKNKKRRKHKKKHGRKHRKEHGHKHGHKYKHKRSHKHDHKHTKHGHKHHQHHEHHQHELSTTTPGIQTTTSAGAATTTTGAAITTAGAETTSAGAETTTSAANKAIDQQEVYNGEAILRDDGQEFDEDTAIGFERPLCYTYRLTDSSTANVCVDFYSVDLTRNKVCTRITGVWKNEERNIETRLSKNVGCKVLAFGE